MDGNAGTDKATTSPKDDALSLGNGDSSHRFASEVLADSVQKFDKNKLDDRISEAELRQAATTSPEAKLLLDNFKLVQNLSNDDPFYEKGISPKDIQAAIQLIDRQDRAQFFAEQDRLRYGVKGEKTGGIGLGFAGFGAYVGAHIGSHIGTYVGGSVGAAKGHLDYYNNKSNIDKLRLDFLHLK